MLSPYKRRNARCEMFFAAARAIFVDLTTVFYIITYSFGFFNRKKKFLFPLDNIFFFVQNKCTYVEKFELVKTIDI